MQTLVFCISHVRYLLILLSKLREKRNAFQEMQ
nr:MAG TPA: hypothetical protein [Caudoviricetes sp.]